MTIFVYEYQCRECNLQHQYRFVDFKTAYDSSKRSKLYLIIPTTTKFSDKTNKADSNDATKIEILCTYSSLVMMMKRTGGSRKYSRRNQKMKGCTAANMDRYGTAMDRVK